VLGAGAFTPLVQHGLVWLGTLGPFERVPGVAPGLLGVTVSAETVRRLTEAAGAALVAAETAQVEQLERTWPRPPVVPPTLQQVSVDGALVPLVGGEWAEVKTLAIGAVEPRRGAPHTTALSYFSRLAEADTFRRLAWVETHRRGLTLAPRVCAVVDGAEWCQKFLDWHCPDAVRILDFPHAAGYLGAAAQAMWGVGTAEARAWLGPMLHTLKTGEPQAVLSALRALPVAEALTPPLAAEKRDAALAYLGARLPQIQYATFEAAGYPIGSGVVESANKRVVEARLKGSGMHWARPNVNPMVALRAAACSGRWAEAWAQSQQQQHQARAARARQRCAARRTPPAPPGAAPAARPPTGRTTVARLRLTRGSGSRPAPNHPWRKPFLPRRPDPVSAKS
jgi:hypothetical protein